jgi:hypothetical protein
MENITEMEAVRFQTVEFSAKGVTLFSQQSKLLFVPREQIRQITLKYGFQSERPIVEILFGIVIIGVGLYLIINIILNILLRQTIHVEQCLSILLLPVGSWFFIDGFRKRLYFEVGLDNDMRKFPLGKNPDKAELQKFIRLAGQFGYTIDSSLLDK